ncbi:hypothetical protein [Rhodoflexus sp.]
MQRYFFTLLIFSVFAFVETVKGQQIVREFPYAGTTYRYRIVPIQDSSAYSLEIQALKSRDKGTIVHKGRIAAVFNHPRRWRIIIYAAQKKKSGWTTQQDSYLETTFDLQQKTVSHFDNGALVDAVEQQLTDNFSAEWAQASSHMALATTVEYFIINYNRALGKHDEGEELETEEAIMLEQMMAERQAERDRQIAAVLEQRQQKADSLAQAVAAATTPDVVVNPPDSLMSLTLADTSSAATDSLALAAIPTAPQLRLEGNFELPFISQLPVDDKVFFVEARIDELNRIELRLRKYDADSNRNELVYVSYLRIKDSTDVSGKYNVLIHLAENNGYEWKTYPGSYLECSLDIEQRKMCYRTVGKLANLLRSPDNRQSEEELTADATVLNKQDVLLAAARFFIKECPKVLVGAN